MIDAEIIVWWGRMAWVGGGGGVVGVPYFGKAREMPTSDTDARKERTLIFKIDFLSLAKLH